MCRSVDKRSRALVTWAPPQHRELFGAPNSAVALHGGKEDGPPYPRRSIVATRRRRSRPVARPRRLQRRRRLRLRRRGASLTFLVDNGEATVATAEAPRRGVQAENPDITIEVETRPQGADGDNVVKTRLATGEMADVFQYNSGSLLQALSPRRHPRRPRRPGLGRQVRRELRARCRPRTASTASPWASRWPAPSSTTRTSTPSSASRSRPPGTSSSRTARRSRRPAWPPRSCRPTATPGPRSCSCSATSTTSSPRTPTGPRSTRATRPSTSTSRRSPGSSTCRRRSRRTSSTRTSRPRPTPTASRMVATGEGAHYPMLTFAASQLDHEPRGGRRCRHLPAARATTPRATD